MHIVVRRKMPVRSIGRLEWLCLIAVSLALLLAGCAQPVSDELPDYGARLPDTAIFVSARNLAKKGLLWLENASGGVQFSSTPPATLRDADVVTILVHGYGTPPGKVATYFEGLISHLRDDARLTTPLVVYDWPSKARRWEELSFDEQSGYIDFLSSTVGEKLGGRIPGLPPGIRWENNQYVFDRLNAQSDGVEGLIRLVQSLVGANPNVKILVVAHSMGCHVVVEALRRQPKAMAPVRRLVLLAPDVDAATFEGDVFKDLSPGPEALHVVYSGHDEIIGTYSRIANLGFPRFGATGPSNPAKLPAYIVVHDATERLGSSGVHSRYVTRDGGGVVGVAAMLTSDRPSPAH